MEPGLQRQPACRRVAGGNPGGGGGLRLSRPQLWLGNHPCGTRTAAVPGDRCVHMGARWAWPRGGPYGSTKEQASSVRSASLPGGRAGLPWPAFAERHVEEGTESPHRPPTQHKQPQECCSRERKVTAPGSPSDGRDSHPFFPFWQWLPQSLPCCRLQPLVPLFMALSLFAERGPLSTANQGTLPYPP